jgi:hypothetical protein
MVASLSDVLKYCGAVYRAFPNYMQQMTGELQDISLRQEGQMNIGPKMILFFCSVVYLSTPFQ